MESRVSTAIFLLVYADGESIRLQQKPFAEQGAKGSARWQ
jgi:hypothetical protein